MAKPTAVTEAGGSKVIILADSTATTPAAKTPAAVVVAPSGESTYPVGWMGLGTHGDADTFTSPGGFVTSPSKGPVVAIAGKDGTTANAIEAATAAPAAGARGLVARLASSSGTAIGTVGLTAGSAVALNAGANTVGAVTQGAGAAVTPWRVQPHDGTNAVAVKAASTAPVAGDPALVVGLSPNSSGSIIGSTRNAGWDQGNLAIQGNRVIGQTSTVAATLITGTATQFLNLMDIDIEVYGGSTAPSAASFISLAYGAGTAMTTEIMRVYIPSAANSVVSKQHSYMIPIKSGASLNLNYQLTSTLGTSGQFSIAAQAHLTTS